MLGVDGDAMVFRYTATAEELPSPFLFLEVESGRIRKEQNREEHAGQSKPRNDIESDLRGDVVEKYSGGQGTELANGGRKAVSRSTDWSGITFSCNEESNCIWAKLVEKRREEIHGLKSLNVSSTGEELVSESRYDEQDKVRAEPDQLHPFATIQFVID